MGKGTSSTSQPALYPVNLIFCSGFGTHGKGGSSSQQKKARWEPRCGYADHFSKLFLLINDLSAWKV
jgi:hypothetical protein